MNKKALRRLYPLLWVIFLGFCFERAESTCIKVVDSEDNESYLVVDSSVEMKLADEMALIVSDKYDFALNISSLKFFQYVPYDLSSANEVSQSFPTVKIVRDELIICVGDKEEYLCRVHDTKGMLTSEFSCRGKYSLSLISFRKGVYILNVENVATVKFIVK